MVEDHLQIHTHGAEGMVNKIVVCSDEGEGRQTKEDRRGRRWDKEQTRSEPAVLICQDRVVPLR